jgi:hypothetical protein
MGAEPLSGTFLDDVESLYGEHVVWCDELNVAHGESRCRSKSQSLLTLRFTSALVGRTCTAVTQDWLHKSCTSGGNP